MQTPTYNASTHPYLLRMEAVHFDQFVFDTTDLSTIRGGGLLLLHSVRLAEQAIQQIDPNGVTLSQGASIGLFAFNAQDPASVLAAVRQKLGQGALQHACFVVACIKSTDGQFTQDVERLVALNHAERVQGLSVRASALTAPDEVPGQAERRKYGREQKQSFYEQLAGARYPNGFASDFNAIAEHSGNKLAVVFADGNQFSQFNQRVEAGALTDWDTDITRKRAQLLAHLVLPLLDLVKETAAPIPFETLLWGGDDMLFVMPANHGLEFAKNLFDHTQNWQHKGNKLTHSVAVVLCHSNAPIRGIKQLAQRLVEAAKADNPGQNALHAVALESFDHVGQDWHGFLERTYHGKFSSKDRLLCANGLQGVLQASGTFKGKDGLPKRRLYDLVEAMLTPSGPWQPTVDRLLHGLSPDTAAEVRKHLPPPPESDTPSAPTAAQTAWWCLVLELWDYVVIPDKTQAPIPPSADPHAKQQAQAPGHPGATE